MTIFLKDPGATIDYAVDWSAGYLAGQTITTSTWDVVPLGDDAVAVDASGIEAGKTVATLSGGREGLLYQITNRVTFSDGRIDERMLALRVEER